MTIELQ